MTMMVGERGIAPFTFRDCDPPSRCPSCGEKSLLFEYEWQLNRCESCSGVLWTGPFRAGERPPCVFLGYHDDFTVWKMEPAGRQGRVVRIVATRTAILGRDDNAVLSAVRRTHFQDLSLIINGIERERWGRYW